MFSNYVFDLYGTLVDIRTDEYDLQVYKQFAEYLADCYGVYYEAEQLKKTYLRALRELEYRESFFRYPEWNVIEVFDEVTGKQLDQKQLYDIAWFYRQKTTKLLKLYPGVRELLKFLRENGKRTILLSNAQACFTRPELEALGLSELLDSIYISSEFGLRKPSESFFRHMLKTEKIDPADAVMIGNDYTCDIEGAKKVGMQGIYIYQDISPASDLDRKMDCLKVFMDKDFEKLSQYLKTDCERK